MGTMGKTNKQTQPRCETRRLSRFLRNAGGLAAVEFALIFPLMLVFYFGAFEATQMLTAGRRVSAVAYTAADLVAQAASVNNADMADVFAASSALLYPLSTTPLTIRVTSVVANSGGVNKVAWSDGHNITPRTVNSNVTLPTGLTSAGTSVIFVEVTYAYSSPVSETITDSIDFEEVAYLKPRRAVSVTRTN